MRNCGAEMQQIYGKWYAFNDYTDELLNARIAYWETALGAQKDWCGVLAHMYDERDRRVDEKLLAWVESK